MSKIKKAADRVARSVDIAMNQQSNGARARAIQHPSSDIAKTRQKKVTRGSKGVKRRGKA